MDKHNFGKADIFGDRRVYFTQGVGILLLLPLINLPHLLRPLYPEYIQLCTFPLAKSLCISADQVFVLWEITENGT